jgi:hypothetical protein
MNQPLAEIIFWIAAIACVVAQAGILRSTLTAQRAGSANQAPVTNRRTELIWPYLLAAVLVLVLGATWKRIDARDTSPAMDHSRMQHSMPMPVTPAPTSGTQ